MSELLMLDFNKDKGIYIKVLKSMNIFKGVLRYVNTYLKKMLVYPF